MHCGLLLQSFRADYGLANYVVNYRIVGACIVSKDGKILGRGHNMRIQKGSATLHVSHGRLTVMDLRNNNC